jgi:hypothetical protein
MLGSLVKKISIVPAEGGWALRSEAIENELYFRSGAAAESAAIRLAQGLALAGEGAQIEIFIRDGTLARRFAVPPSVQAAARVAEASAAASQTQDSRRAARPVTP